MFLFLFFASVLFFVFVFSFLPSFLKWKNCYVQNDIEGSHVYCRNNTCKDQASAATTFNSISLESWGLLKMIDWGLNVEGFSTPLKLIVPIPVSLQTVNLDFLAFLAKCCETAVDFRQRWRWGAKTPDKQAEQCPHHSSALTGLPTHEF